MQSRERADSELGEHVKKAVDPVEDAPKAKHVRCIVTYTWDYRTTLPFWNFLMMQPILTDPVQIFKASVVVHRLLISGPPQALVECKQKEEILAHFLNASFHFTNSLYTPLIKNYLTFLKRKIDFHHTHLLFNKGNFAYNEEITLKSVVNLEEGYQTVGELLNLITILMEFGNLVFDQLYRYQISGGPGECRSSALVPAIEESNGIYQYITAMLSAMHLCMENFEFLRPLVERYRQLFAVLKSFYQNCRQNHHYLAGIVNIPDLPREPVDFTSSHSANRKYSSDLSLRGSPSAQSMSNSGDELSYYKEERYYNGGTDNQDALVALKALHEKYLKIKKEASGYKKQNDQLKAQCMHLKKETDDLRSINRYQSETLKESEIEKEEEKKRLSSVINLYNGLKSRFVQEIKSKDEEILGLRQEREDLSNQLVITYHQMNDQSPKPEPVEQLEEAEVIDGTIASEDELKQVLQMILNVEQKLIEYRKEEENEESIMIPHLTSEVAELIRCSIAVQDLILTNADDIKDFYNKNPVWSKGLISAAKAIGYFIRLLSEHYFSEHPDEEKIKAAIIQVNSGVVHLVSAARVKAPAGPALDALLESAGKISLLIRQNISPKEISDQNDRKDIDKEEEAINEMALKVQEMDLTAEVLKRQKELEQAREKLAQIRKSNYNNAGEKGQSPKAQPNK
jgi:hypothetical protein